MRRQPKATGRTDTGRATREGGRAIVKEEDIFVTEETAEEVSLGHYIAVILQRKWLILACVVVALGAVLLQSFLTTPRYRATAQIVRETTSLETALFGTRIFENRDVQRELRTSAEMVTSPEVAEAVKVKINSPLSAQSLIARTTATPATQADFITISATSTVPQEAADIANAFATEYIAMQRASDRQAINLARDVVEAELSRMSVTELASDRGRALSERLEELAIIEQLQTGGFKVSEAAIIPGVPYTPQPVRNSILAVMVGLVVGIGIAFLVEYFDRRIKNEEMASQAFDLPVVGTVPMVGKGWIDSGKNQSRSPLPLGFHERHSPTLEAFRAIRSNLRYFAVDRELTSVLVTSSLPQEGKTITTLNLGLALALSGARVVVIEADLRKPALHRYLGVPNDVGLTNVLAGTHTLAEGFQLVQVDTYLSEDKRKSAPNAAGLAQQKNLYVMTCGPIPPNPTELLGSSRMAEVLAKTSASADYVLLDSPPVLLVADALALASLADGVLLTCRLNHTTTDAARESRLLLDRAKAELLGVLVEGLKHPTGYYSRYGYGRYGYGRRYGYGYGYGYGTDLADTEEATGSAGGVSVV